MKRRVYLRQVAVPGTVASCAEIALQQNERVVSAAYIYWQTPTAGGHPGYWNVTIEVTVSA